jgi:hypothetical protein
VKKSRFAGSEILAILTDVRLGIPVAEVYRKHGITAPTITCGRAVLVCRCQSANGSKSETLRMPSTNGCMPSWRWQIWQSRTFSPESFSAVGEIIDCRKPRPGTFEASRGRRYYGSESIQSSAMVPW